MTRPTLLAAAFAVALAPAVLADPQIEIVDPYARSSGMTAISGAAFMVLRNAGTTDDRLVGAASPVAERVELHTHIESETGVMRMVEIEGGIALPAGSEHAFQRGGDHVMFLGITTPFENGATVPLTLTFERAGDVTVDVPVDLQRMPGGHGGHGMKMGN